MSQEIIIDGQKPIFHVIMNREEFGLSAEEAQNQDMPAEYAIIANPNAAGGLVVYAKFPASNEWLPNPFSSRFLVRVLLEKLGISLNNT